MNQDSSPPRQSISDEEIRSGKVLQDVLVVDVVHLDDQMLVGLEEVLIQREPYR